MEKEALTELLPVVYRFALRLGGDAHLAEDIAQETLLRAFAKPNRQPNVKNLRPWLLRITLNLYRDHYRRTKTLSWSPLEGSCDVPATDGRPIEQLERREQVERAMQHLDRLPPRQRSVLHLVTCEELSIAEVAEILELSPGAVKSSLSMARKEMRKRMFDPRPPATTVPITNQVPPEDAP